MGSEKLLETYNLMGRFEWNYKTYSLWKIY
jgi:hypothetical protein